MVSIYTFSLMAFTSSGSMINLGAVAKCLSVGHPSPPNFPMTLRVLGIDLGMMLSGRLWQPSVFGHLHAMSEWQHFGHNSAL